MVRKENQVFFRETYAASPPSEGIAVPRLSAVLYCGVESTSTAVSRLSVVLYCGVVENASTVSAQFSTAARVSSFANPEISMYSLVIVI